jgi:Ca2+-transporting ATPase
LTDGLIGLGLGLEPPDPFVMKRKPFRPDEGIFSHGLGSHILWVGLYIGSISLGLGVWYFTTGRENWQTIMFANIAFMQVVQGFAIRSSSRSIFRISLFSNPVLLVVGLVAILTQFPVIYYPPLQEIFGTKPLLLFDFLTIIAASVSLLIFVELEKFIGRYKK